MDVKNLTIRTISGFLYVALIVGCILGGEWTLRILASLFTILGVWEFFGITRTGENRREHATVIVDILGALCLCWLPSLWPLFLFVVLTGLRLILELYTHTEHPLRNVTMSVFSMIYIGLPMGLMTLLADLMNSTMPILLIFIMIWLNDTGAFLIGSLCGRHRLFYRVSPKKSWEGFLGGLGCNIIFSLVIGMCCPQFFDLHKGLGFWIGLSFVVTVFATWGDLFESLYKRNLNIKDSGKLIPGHGGILDRIDSLLLVMPLVAIYFILIDWFSLSTALTAF